MNLGARASDEDEEDEEIDESWIKRKALVQCFIRKVIASILKQLASNGAKKTKKDTSLP